MFQEIIAMLKGDKNIQIDFVTILHSCFKDLLDGKKDRHKNAR